MNVSLEAYTRCPVSGILREEYCSAKMLGTGQHAAFLCIVTGERSSESAAARGRPKVRVYDGRFKQKLAPKMIFFSLFKTLVGKEICVELKNDVVLTGTLLSVDQYLNVKLENVNVVDSDRYPQLVSRPRQSRLSTGRQETPTPNVSWAAFFPPHSS